MFVMSEPNADVALWLIRIAVIARILHTIVSFKIYYLIILTSDISRFRFMPFTQSDNQLEDCVLA